MKPLLAFCCLVTALSAADDWKPLWPGEAPGAKRPPAGSESIANGWRYSDIEVPQYLVYPAPADKRTGQAVVIFPGGGYGIPTPGMIESVGLLARLEGIVLDTVYSGKAMAGLIDLVRSGHFGADETIEFIHTFGAPEMFDYAECF